MKNIRLTLIACFLVNTLNAQEVSYSKNIISTDDEPYAKLVKEGSMLRREYSLQNMDGEELVAVKLDDRGNKNPADDRYVLYFLESGQKAAMPQDIGFGKKLAKEIAKRNLIKNGKINPKGEQQFLQVYPYTEASTAGEETTGGNDYHIAEHDHTKPIAVNGSTLLQGGVEIGTYRDAQGNNMGKVYTTYSFFLPDGTKVAEGNVELNGTSGTFTTLKDNKQHNLNFSSTFKWDIAKEAAKYLSSKYYM